MAFGDGDGFGILSGQAQRGYSKSRAEAGFATGARRVGVVGVTNAIVAEELNRR
jgi:hypothetical protein